MLLIQRRQQRRPACLFLASAVMRQRRIHQRQPGPLMQCRKRHHRQTRCITGNRLAQPVLLARHQRRAKLRCAYVKIGEGTGNMRRIGRGKGGQPQKPPADQPVNRTKRKLRCGNLGDRCRPHLDGLLRQPCLRPRQPARHPVRHHRKDKARICLHRHRQPKLLFHDGDDLRMLRCQQ